MDTMTPLTTSITPPATGETTPAPAVPERREAPGARGAAVRFEDGVPVYRTGQAPEKLLTKTDLAGLRRRPAEGRKPVAYVISQATGRRGELIALWDVRRSRKLPPLSPKEQAAWEARRTCPECGRLRQYIVHTRCTPCGTRAEKARQRLYARTCWACRSVAARPLPKHQRCRECRHKQLADGRAKAEKWVAEVTVCAGDGTPKPDGERCTRRMVTKKAAWECVREQGVARGWWNRRPDWPVRCPDCIAAAQEHAAERQAEWERQQAARHDAERREAEARIRWAAEALADPNVVILDTETTGLHDTARIVEIAVLTTAGEVLLDTLLDPGEPIPDDVADVHGITDAAVAGAPTFASILPALTEALAGRRCLIYNDTYDVGRLRHELTVHHQAAGHPDPAAAARAWVDALTFEDVMVPYSDWVGDWSDYWGSNTWQPLHGGHRAAGDCRAVIQCLQAMADSRGADEDPWAVTGGPAG